MAYFHASLSFYPECSCNDLLNVIHTYRSLFRTVPGETEVAFHYITTTGTPVRVPPRRIPGHYRQEIEKQINTMLEQGIIEESSSPWMAPAVFVPKKSGEIRMCTDYRELNKKMPTPCHYPMKSKIVLQVQPYFPHSTFKVATGNYK